MISKGYLSGRRSQRGQTILLVAVSMVSLLAMAALAIDVVTLYVARTEIQRAADAAALVGAKAIADSGVTTLPSGSGDLAAATTLATSMANSAITAVINASPPINQVAGNPPSLVSTTFNFTPNNNPRVTVTLQQTNLPTFFARIFGQRSATTGASATAEAYNPSNLANFTPITPRCVKPWLVANIDPTNPGNSFVDPTTGAVVANLATLAATPFYLSADCVKGNPGCSVNNQPMTVLIGETGVQYLPAFVADPTIANACPSCVGATSFEQGVACCDVNTNYSCGGTTPNASWDSALNPEHGGFSSPSALANECLIHALNTGPGQGQDALDYPTPWPDGPPRITAGTRNPMNNQVVTTSSSIVTMPIIDPNGFNHFGSSPVTVFGFLQAFVNSVSGASGHVGEINITVLNVIGCSPSPNANPPIVGGNGASAIPVRLITPP